MASPLRPKSFLTAVFRWSISTGRDSEAATDDNHITSLGGTGILGKGFIIHESVGSEFLQFGNDLFLFRVVGYIDNRICGCDNDALGREPLQIAQTLQRFHAENHVGIALSDQIGEDLTVGNTQMGHYGASTLGHTVNLGLTDLISRFCGGGGDYGGQGKNPLPLLHRKELYRISYLYLLVVTAA